MCLDGTRVSRLRPAYPVDLERIIWGIEGIIRDSGMVSERQNTLDHNTHIESLGPSGGTIRKGCVCAISGFQPRNRLPALPVSGVKKPAPVASGTALAICSSGGARLTGGGLGGKMSSTSGIDPKMDQISLK